MACTAACVATVRSARPRVDVSVRGLALSILMITALIGARDLGQEVYIAPTKANAGQGIVAGLSVAFIAIIGDRIVNSLADGQRRRLGM